QVRWRRFAARVATQWPLTRRPVSANASGLTDSANACGVVAWPLEAVCVKVAFPETGGDTVLSVAVIVTWWAVVELLIVTLYVPSPWSLTALICSPESLEEKPTLSPGTGLPFASFTVAVAVAVEVPFATIDAGEIPAPTLAAGPRVWVSVA